MPRELHDKYSTAMGKASRLANETLSPKFLDFPDSEPKELVALLQTACDELLYLFDNMPRVKVRIFTKNDSGKYEHRLVNGGVGHNLPQEAPQAFVEAVIEVDGY